MKVGSLDIKTKKLTQQRRATMLKRILSFALIVVCCINFNGVNTFAAEPVTLEFLTEAIYDDIKHYSEGLAVTKQGDIYTFIDENGKTVSSKMTYESIFNVTEYPEDYEDDFYGRYWNIGDFHEGVSVAWSHEENNFVYLDSDGKTFYHTNNEFWGEPNYALGFSEGVVAAGVSNSSDGGAPSLYTKEGRSSDLDEGIYDRWLDIWFDDYFFEGLIKFTDRYVGEVGFADKDYNMVIEGQFEDAQRFNQGLAPVQKDGKWGFIDKSGKFVIQPQFDSVFRADPHYSHRVFNEGLATVEKNGKFGLIDKTGNVVVDFKYDTLGVVVNGFCYYGIGDKQGFIDFNGIEIIKPTHDYVAYFNSDGYTIAVNNDVYTIIDKNGNRVSQEDWKFDNMRIDASYPHLYFYEQNDKWGVAKISSSSQSSEGTTTAPIQTTSSIQAVPTASAVKIDGKQVDFQAYNIDGNNYFKLRDLAFALNNTTSEFNITWDAEKNLIQLIQNTSYEAVGNELEKNTAPFKTITENKSVIMVDSKEVTLQAYNIDGNNYFKLRDIGELIDFSVNWDSVNSIISIETDKGYN